MIIRDAVKEDIFELAAIYNWAVANTAATFDIEPKTIDERLEWFDHYGGKHPLIVAETDGKAAGYSSLSKFREKEAYRQTAELSVYVCPEYQGKGIGKALIREIIDRARRLEYHAIMAGITADNTISIALHEKLGFEHCGTFREVGYKFDRWQDVLFYQLIL